MNPMATTYQNPTIDMQKLERKEHKYTTKENHFMCLLAYDPRYDLSWKMFHEHLRRKCILLFLDGMSYKYQLIPSCLMCHLKLVFPYLFSFWMIWLLNITNH